MRIFRSWIQVFSHGQLQALQAPARNAQAAEDRPQVRHVDSHRLRRQLPYPKGLQEGILIHRGFGHAWYSNLRKILWHVRCWTYSFWTKFICQGRPPRPRERSAGWYGIEINSTPGSRMFHQWSDHCIGKRKVWDCIVGSARSQIGDWILHLDCLSFGLWLNQRESFWVRNLAPQLGSV